MKKQVFKRCLLVMLAAALMYVLVPAEGIKAASANVLYNTYENAKGVKKSNKNVVLTVNHYHKVDVEGADVDKGSVKTDKHVSAVLREGGISISADKAGKYKLEFKAGGKKIKLNVIVLANSSSIEKATYDSQVVYSTEVKVSEGTWRKDSKMLSAVKKGSGKFTVKPGKGVKVTGYLVVTADKKGKLTAKTYKNGSKITLSKGGTLIKYTDGSSYVDGINVTEIFVSYKSSNTGYAYSYSVAKKDGKKCIKKIITYPDNTKKVEYLDLYTSGTFSLYQ